MKRFLNHLITEIISVFLPPLPSSKTYWINPKPGYISQFGKIILNPPKSYWPWRNCGIACVKMILDSNGKKYPIMELTKYGVKLGGYDTKNDIGWYHKSLAKLLQIHGLNAKIKKWQSIESVAHDILGNKKVILSVTVPQRSKIDPSGNFQPLPGAKYLGHLVLATGVKIQNGKVEEIYVHDPRGLPKYQANTVISNNTLKEIFTNRTIVAS